jgi:hypothetical protein
MKRSLIGLLVLLFFAQACGPLTPMPAPTTVATVAPTISTSTPVSVTEAAVTESAPGLKGLGGVPCPDSDFTCVTLTVPLNHFDPNDSRTIKVVFAILPATGERKGMFVTATGGPGSAGITSADSYILTLYFSTSAVSASPADCNARRPRPHSIKATGAPARPRRKPRW